MPPASEDNCPAGRQAELMAETIMDNCNGDNNASLILRTWDPLHRTAPCLFLLTGGWRRAQKYAIKREKNPTATQDLQRSAAKYKKKKIGKEIIATCASGKGVLQFADTAACKCNTNFAVLRPFRQQQ